jgi:hypothetical protein
MKSRKYSVGRKVKVNFHGAICEGEILYFYPINKIPRNTLAEVEIRYQGTVYSISRYIYEIKLVQTKIS